MVKVQFYHLFADGMKFFERIWIEILSAKIANGKRWRTPAQGSDLSIKAVEGSNLIRRRWLEAINLRDILKALAGELKKRCFGLISQDFLIEIPSTGDPGDNQFCFFFGKLGLAFGRHMPLFFQWQQNMVR